jgi:hypothetical protein
LQITDILQEETPQVPARLASVLNVIAEAGLVLVLEDVTSVRRKVGTHLTGSVHKELVAAVAAAARPGG